MAEWGQLDGFVDGWMYQLVNPTGRCTVRKIEADFDDCWCAEKDAHGLYMRAKCAGRFYKIHPVERQVRFDGRYFTLWMVNRNDAYAEKKLRKAFSKRLRERHNELKKRLAKVKDKIDELENSDDIHGVDLLDR